MNLRKLETPKQGFVKALIVGAAMTVASAALAQPTVTVGEASGQQGGTATVTLTLDNPVGDASTEVTALNFDILFDETVLTGVDLSDCDGNSANPGGVTCTNPSDGRIVVFVGTFPTAPVGSGQFGTLTFDIDPAADFDDYELELSNSNFSNAAGDEVLPAAMNNGTVTVQDVTAVLNVQPPELLFGNQQTGSTSAPLPVTISNDGSDGIALEVTDIAVSGPFDLEGGGSCGAVPFFLADGESCTQHVEFSPTSDGPTSGTLTVTSDAGDTVNDSVALSGTGVPSDAELVIDPTSFDFGELDINEAAICEVFTLSNTPGDDPLTIDTAAIFGGAISPHGASGPTAFEIVDNNCDGVTLGGGESCTIEVCFDPDEAISYFGELNVTSDANSVSADLEGLGTEESDVTVFPPFSQDADDVISIGVGEPGSTVSFTDGLVSNSGSADAEVACEFTSNPGDVFSTDPSPLAGTIPAVDGSIAFSLFCDLPGDADEGDTFNATLSCSVDGEPAGEHFLSCGVRVFDPVPVNTMQPLGLALFALLMLLIGGISIRLFRAS